MQKTSFWGQCPKNLFQQWFVVRVTTLCHSELSWISFTKTSRSFHYVSTHFCFCNFGSTLLLRPTQIRLFQGLVQQKISLRMTYCHSESKVFVLLDLWNIIIQKYFIKQAIFWKRNTLYKCNQLRTCAELRKKHLKTLKLKTHISKPNKNKGLEYIVKFCCITYIKKVNFWKLKYLIKE